MKAEALLVQEKSGYALVEPRCRYFGTCGGCTLQDLSSADQLALKQERLRRLLAPLGHAPSPTVVPAEEPWRYRNKAEFTFGAVDGQLLLGYHAARSFWKIVDLDDCLLMPEAAMRVVRAVQALAARSGAPAYHPRTHQGFFRYVLVRHSRATGQLLICLMTSPGDRAVIEGIAHELLPRHPEITSFLWGITSRLADIAVPEQLETLHGLAHLDDQVGPFRVRLHPLSFLQPNGVQADRIYRRLAELVRGSPQGIAWDLYCGIGLVGFYLAGKFQRVYGIDIDPRHTELAASNAALNRLENMTFRAGRVETALLDRRFWLQEAKPDLIVVDPPRAGLHPQALSSLLAARPTQIAYLSCNAQSFVRDLQVLQSQFPRYRIAALEAFDMFPQTNHLETLALLDRA